MDPRAAGGCALCGARPTEAHHAAGRAHDCELVVDLCLAHHRLIHDDMADAGCDLRHSPLRAPGESIAEGLRCLGTLFARVAGVGDVAWLGAVSDYLIRCADTLTYLICLLDARLPGWRSHIHEGELP